MVELDVRREELLYRLHVASVVGLPEETVYEPTLALVQKPRAPSAEARRSRPASISGDRPWNEHPRALARVIDRG
jgi:hypothetical protein